jgi:hypothetical protein
MPVRGCGAGQNIVEDPFGRQIAFDLTEFALEEAVGLIQGRRGAALGALMFD